MSAAIVTQIVGDLRGGLHDVGARFVLAVERTQRVGFRTTTTLFAHFVLMVENELAHAFAICRLLYGEGDFRTG